ADEEEKKVTIKAESMGGVVAEWDIRTASNNGIVEIEVLPRNERRRVDLYVRVPSRARVKIRTEAGAVDVVGNVADAEVATDTGTIRVAVPTDAVRYNFSWQASRPRYFSDTELPKEKEKAGGEFVINGKLGDAKAKPEARVELRFTTQRGVVLFNVDPEMVPADLRERPLTKAAQAIVESGDGELIEAIRKVSPRLFADYTRDLPQHSAAPTLVARRKSLDVATSAGGQLMKINVNVADRTGRAIGDLKAADFSIIENGEARTIENVALSSAPFNLVLLLDVSGSVEERLDFIRKAGRQFLNTASAQDRIAIVSFRDDVQLISDFSADRRVLATRLDQIDAGGATALYDAIAYALVHTLRPLRGERTAIVILSDGDDNKSFVPFPSLLQATRESGALIYPLYVPSELIPAGSATVENSSSLDPLRTRYLTVTSRANEEGQKLASASGGVYYPITRIEELQRAYDDVVTQLRLSYTITYQSTASNNDEARERRVRVRVNREGASVRLSPAINVAAN
ncbi:MAG: VWA domain-containing protein, partial [Pyrinomonadaceae bacterium]